MVQQISKLKDMVAYQAGSIVSKEIIKKQTDRYCNNICH